MTDAACAFCGASVLLPERAQPGRGDTCDRCQGNIHSCRQCRFYNDGIAHECSEPRAERVIDKTAANFCQWYEFRGGTGGEDPALAAARAAKAVLEGLFKK